MKQMVMMGAVLASAMALASMDVIKERREGFEAFKEEMGAIKKIVTAADAGQQGELVRHVSQLTDATEKQWARFDELFPAGSYTGKTDALPAIWEKPEEFKAALEKNRQALALLQDAAKSADPDQWKAAFGKVGGSCKGCHENFKKD